MKFGKEFRIHLQETLPEWRDKYLSYKPLKKLLKNIPASAPADNPPPDGPLPEIQDWFVRILNVELDKFNDFYVDKEEDFIIRFQDLKERIERLKVRGSTDGVFTSETEFSEEMMEIRKDFVAIHGEMVLKNYSSLNFAGLIKILKKYDKRTGELLSLPFTQLAFNQPFFTIEPLTRLVRECEANLEVLFPLEAEVVESVTDQTEQTESTDKSMPLGEETMDIYRSTLAAIKAIQGLKKASSTYNPMSLSYLFGNQDNDGGTGAVTEENSPSDSFVSLHKGDDANADVCSPK